MSKTLLLCICKDDESVINEAKGSVGRSDYHYFGARMAGIAGQLEMLKKVSTIIVTAHGDEYFIGNKLAGFIDISAENFADILNKVNFSGQVYFHACEGHAYGKNVKRHLTCNAKIHGVKGDAKMAIDLHDCEPC